MKFVREILIDKLNPANYHVRYGRHSNIKDCCIWFFLNTWRPHWRKNKLLDHEYREAMHIIARNAQYIVCPNCLLTGKINKLHRCSWKCKWFLESIKGKQ